MPGPYLRFDGRDLAPAAVDSYGHLLALPSDLIKRAPVALQRGFPARAAQERNKSRLLAEVYCQLQRS